VTGTPPPKIIRPSRELRGGFPKIAQRLSAGVLAHGQHESRQGRKNHSAVPDGTFYFVVTFNPALKGWAIFECRPDAEPPRTLTTAKFHGKMLLADWLHAVVGSVNLAFGCGARRNTCRASGTF
jgi:hypothetical protein